MAAPQWHAPLVERLDGIDATRRQALHCPGGGAGALTALAVADTEVAEVMRAVAARPATAPLIARLLEHGARAMTALAEQTRTVVAAHDDGTGWPDPAAVAAVDLGDDDEEEDDVERQAGPAAAPVSLEEQAAVTVAAAPADPVADAVAVLVDRPAGGVDAVARSEDPVVEAQETVWQVHLDHDAYPLPDDLRAFDAAADRLAIEVNAYAGHLAIVGDSLGLPELPPELPHGVRRARQVEQVVDLARRHAVFTSDVAEALGLSALADEQAVLAEVRRLRKQVSTAQIRDAAARPR